MLGPVPSIIFRQSVRSPHANRRHGTYLFKLPHANLVSASLPWPPVVPSFRRCLGWVPGSGLVIPSEEVRLEGVGLMCLRQASPAFQSMGLAEAAPGSVGLYGPRGSEEEGSTCDGATELSCPTHCSWAEQHW